MFEENIRKWYQEDEGKLYHSAKRSIPPHAYDWVARIRARKIQPFVNPSDFVMEYGVGLGWNLASVQCRRKIGYDIGKFLEPIVREHGIEFTADLTELDRGGIDLALCHHVLEHVASPPALLQELRSLLRPGGTLLAFVPFEKERRYRRYNPEEPNHHLYSWNVQTLGNLIEQCGFKVEAGSVGMFSYDRFSAVWASRMGLGEKGYRVIRALIHKIRPCLEARIVASALPDRI